MKEISEHKGIALNQQSQINFKEYIISRLETFDEICRVIYAFEKVFNPPLSERISDLDLYAEKLRRNAIVYVAKDVEVFGLVAFYANDGSTRIAYLTQIAVQPNAQTRKIGKTLLDLCIEVSKSKGMTEIRLEVHNHNCRAIRFYERNGFEFLGQASVDSMYMKRKL